jgi:hypothetical protein
MIVQVPFWGSSSGVAFDHYAIVVRSGDLTYVLARDLTYRQYLLMEDVVDGMTENPMVSLASLGALKQFTQQEPTVPLPAHDPEAAKRLAGGLTMYPRSPAQKCLWPTTNPASACPRKKGMALT